MLTIEQYEAGERESFGRRFYQTMPPLKADEYEALRASGRGRLASWFASEDAEAA